MKSRIKTTLVILILFLTMSCLVLAMVAIFAANREVFNTGISINYEAPEIVGNFSAKYYIFFQNGDILNPPGNNIEFAVKAEHDIYYPKKNVSQMINLSPTSSIISAVYEFEFQNGLENLTGKDFLAKLSFNNYSAENAKITTKQSEKKITDFDRIVAEVDAATGEDKGWMVVENEKPIATKYFYVKIEPKTEESATFQCSFHWELNLAEPSLDALEFELTNNSYYSVKYKDSAVAPTYLIIPKTYTGEDGVERPVTSIPVSGFGYYKNKDGHIYIPKSITHIGGFSFSGIYTTLNEFVMPDNMFIGGMNFEDGNIQSLIIGKNVTIDDGAFDGCPIKSLTIEGNLPDFVELRLMGMPIETLIIGENASINNDSFSFLTDLKRVSIDSKTVCDNLMNWENGVGGTKTYLIDVTTTIKSKYEIVGIENYSRKFTRSESQDNGGYWVYTYAG